MNIRDLVEQLFPVLLYLVIGLYLISLMMMKFGNDIFVDLGGKGVILISVGVACLIPVFIFLGLAY